MAGAPHRLLLIGGGHSHLEVLRQFARAPERRIALTLVSPDAQTPYSAMLPGLIAGHYTVAESHIALAPLAAWAHARLMAGSVSALDPVARNVTLESGATIAFDSASIDIGSTPDMTVSGARQHAIGVKPIALFLMAWATIIADVQARRISTLAVVGGGVGGVELVLAMHYRLHALLGADATKLALISDNLNVPSSVRRRLMALLAARDIDVHLGSGVAAVAETEIGAPLALRAFPPGGSEPSFGRPGGVLELQSGERVDAECIVWATAASAAPWLAGSGLACDALGFVRVNDYLQSPSHPCIFAAGDCATQDGRPRPKSGVFAVREGPPLAINLRRAALGRPMAPFVPQRHTLGLISTGGKEAIAAYGPFAIGGSWVWRWKDRIDRRFVARYRPPR